jgi:glycosyltransferase involved in cell wall biosynthesis
LLSFEDRCALTRQKLVYVLPTYDVDSSEHLYHIYGFLDNVAANCDTWLIIERARGNPRFRNVRVYRRTLQVPLLQSIEVLLVMLWARLHGYRRFYVHYSVSSAILAAIVTRILGGESFYWNCGHPLNFIPARIRSWSDWQTKVRNQYLLGLTLHLVHHLVTGTETMARYYSDGYHLPLESIRVLPNWVDLERFRSLPGKGALRAQLRWSPDQKVILFLHRLVERKGAHYIVPIAQEVLARCPQWTSQILFVVAGDGPYRQQLAADIQHAGLGGRFTLVGAVPNREAIQYFAAADVYMMPSTEEGFPRALLEAMAAGCPFTATDVGGVRDILTPVQREFIVSVGNCTAMAKVVVRLLTDDALQGKLVQEGLANVMNFDQGLVVQAFVRMIVAECPS